MKDLLYLKDEQIKEFIQLLYYAYRETFSDPKEILSKKYSKTYFLIKLSFIVFAIALNFFSKIAIEDGLFLVFFL